MTGGSGSDVFVFENGSNDDVITDFGNGNDDIDLSALGVTTFAQVQAALSSNGAGDAVIDLSALGGNGSVTLTGVDVSAMDATDFILA